MSAQTTFVYRATDAAGRIDRGVIQAESLAEAKAMLVARGWYVLRVSGRVAHVAKGVHMSSADLAVGLRVLADLVDSGLSVGRALHVFEELAPRGWRTVVPWLRDAVQEGRALGSALAEAPIAIPPLVAGIIQAGEAGAGLAPSLRRAAELSETTAELRASLRAALAYPIVVAAAGVSAIVVLVGVVLPRFAVLLNDLGQDLPASTRLVLSVATSVQAAFVPVAIAVVCTSVMLTRWIATPRGRRVWHWTLLHAPMIGGLRRATATSRAAHSLGTLIENGVTLASALTYAARASGDAVIEERWLAARANVASGEPLSRALELNAAATAATVRLVRAGEESSRLPAMLAHIARIESQRAERVLRASVRLLEPVLLVLFASAVALIAAALLQAVYSVRPAP